MRQPPNDPARQQSPDPQRPALHYAHGDATLDPWLPVVRFAAAAGLLDGAWSVMESVSYFAWVHHQGSSLPALLFYLSWRETAEASGNLGLLAFGALLTHASIRCLGRRPAYRRAFLTGLAGVAACAAAAQAERAVNVVTWWRDGIRFRGATAATIQVATSLLLMVRPLLIPALAWYVMTRPQVTSRFRTARPGA